MRGTSIVSSSANADRDEERNVNPAGWPSRLRRRPHQRDVGLSLLESLERAFCPGKILYRARRHRPYAGGLPRPPQRFSLFHSFILWSILRGNGAHTPHPDLEMCNSLRSILIQILTLKLTRDEIAACGSGGVGRATRFCFHWPASKNCLSS